jgi:ATP-binding cassette subfamily B (MDR/TAP) protein 1
MHIYTDHGSGIVNNMSLDLTFVAIGAGVSMTFAQVFVMISNQEVSNRIKRAYFVSVTNQEIGFFDRKKAGHLLKLVTEDVTKMTTAYTTTLGGLGMNVGQIVGGLVFAFKTSWLLTLLGLTSVPLIIIVLGTCSGIITFLTRKADSLLKDSVSTANEVISSMKTVRSMAGEKKESIRYVSDLNKIGVTGYFSALAQGINNGCNNFFLYGGICLTLWYGGKLVGDGTIQAGVLVQMWGYILMSCMGIQTFLNNASEIVKAGESGRLLLNVIMRKPAMSLKGGKELKKVQGHIAFKNVTFRYPTRPKVAVLKNFSVDIHQGQSVALVGPSGSGKSTIVGLLERWYEPEEGSVTVDGVEIAEIDPQSLHRYIGIVQQEPTLFATTIKRNIIYAVECANGIIRDKALKEGKTDQEIEAMLISVTEEKIIEAAKAANAHDFISKLPLGYDTVLGERGVSLSGGQKQRVAIARAILQDPSILLLDEATSALDTKSEALVQDALDKLMKGRTSIIIAHRLSTIQNCDKILVLKSGEIVEQGTHDQLIEIANGVYFGLAQKQMNLKRSTSSSQSLDTQSSSKMSRSESVDSDLDVVELKDSETPSTATSDSAVNLVAVKKQPKKGSVFQRIKENRKKMKKEEFTNEEDIADVREPKIRSTIPILAIFGWDWVAIVISIIAAAIVGSIPIIFQLLFGRLLNSISPSKNADGAYIPFPPGYSISGTVATYAMYLTFVTIGTGIGNFVSTFFSNFARERIAVRVKKAYFNAILKQEMGFFDIKKTGKILSSISEDVLAVVEGYSTKITLVCQSLAQFVVGIIVALTTSWKMSLVMLGGGIGSIFIIVAITAFVANFFNKKISKLVGSSVTTATEVIGAIRTVRSMAGEEREQRRYQVDLTRLSIFNVARSLVLAVAIGMIFFAMWADSALALWYGGTLVVAGELKPGDLFQVFGNILFAVLGISVGMAELQAFLRADQSAREILKVTLRVPAIPTEGGKKLEKVVGDVEFKNIDFAYPSRPDITVLKNFSLNIARGTHVALVGESGSGKSTITGLIERFYDPASGSVFIDGVDIKELDTEWLHQNVAIVNQEPVLFATSIRRNITYAVGDHAVSMDQVIQAAKAANAHDFISSLPDGYDTMIGERGVSMSGGQKQRIAIARAMLQNSSILILDEATSALDTEAEALVQAALDRLMVNKTSIVIAHRLSTVKDCDVIVVMKQGEAMEMGTHDELLQNTNGLYYKLAQKQMSYGQQEGNNVTITEED